MEPYCHCDAHLYDPQMTRYKKLADKEKLLHDELSELNQQMAELTSSILEHECDTIDEKMQTIYQTDYIKRGRCITELQCNLYLFINYIIGLNLTQYRTLMPAVESPVGIPVRSQSIGLGKGYRDPTMFRYSCFNKPMIHPPPPISFATSRIKFHFFMFMFLLKTIFFSPMLTR